MPQGGRGEPRRRDDVWACRQAYRLAKRNYLSAVFEAVRLAEQVVAGVAVPPKLVATANKTLVTMLIDAERAAKLHQQSADSRRP